MTRKKSGAAQKEPEPRGLHLSSQNRAPLYHQIYLILRSRILDGDYGPGAYVPGERELETMFKVSRITAVRALNELAAAGLVIRERGRGTRVQFVGSGVVSRGPAGTSEDDSKVPRGRPFEVFDSLHDKGTAEVTVYEFEYIAPSPSVAAALKLPRGAEVQYAARVWRFEKSLPFNYVVTFVPADIGRHWTRRDLERTPLGDLLEKHGIEVALVQERVTATLADNILSERLDVALGSPILKIRRTTFDANGKPIEHMTGFYPPDRYQYEVTLPRKRPKDKAEPPRLKARPRRKG